MLSKVAYMAFAKTNISLIRNKKVVFFPSSSEIIIVCIKYHHVQAAVDPHP